MPRTKNTVAGRARRKRVLKQTHGFVGGRGKLYRTARETLDRALVYAYRDRKTKKRNYRALWQIRINAAARAAGITYSRFIEGMKAAKVDLDRKTLADIAATDNAAFTELVRVAQDALKTKAKAA